MMMGSGMSESKCWFNIQLLMLMLLVQQSMQLRWNHPLHEVVDQINRHGGPYVGLVLAFLAEERPLLASRLFVPDSDFPVNAAITPEILLQAFDVRGVVHYGIAGGTDTSLNVGDVGVANYFAFTSSWKWTQFGSTDRGELKFGAYNLPSAGGNLLAELQFTPVQLFSNGKAMEELFWLPVDPHWYQLAIQLKGLKLQRCLNETLCLPKQPKVVLGLRGSTANVFLANEAYAKFLLQQFNISIADEESASVLMTSLSNGVPCIVFRGVSDVAGGDHLALAGLSSLAAVNSFTVAAKFVQLIARKKATF
ncbi:hypothetical protein Cgig2_017775 [Carnegiea gigantea]|uniref:Nucleoside phosphorylase domain-containing protein n=1 Tax=Carnegiea gigantea TaxID=171969 RepID=A0A9Q1KXA5_9CARY|nr:hypothetical protein Cgig2_017775 [Carnegiea gigantea]